MLKLKTQLDIVKYSLWVKNISARGRPGGVGPPTVINADVTWTSLHLMKNDVTSVRYIYKSYYFYMSPSYVFYIPVQIGLLFDISFSLNVLSSVSAYRTVKKRRTVRRTALNNIIAETSLPVTQFDTSFETLVNSRQHTIEDIVRDALQQHGY